jgi:hypothetical protein
MLCPLNSGVVFGVSFSFTLGAIAAAYGYEATRPTAPCVLPPSDRDFGAPEGCNDGPGDHPKTISAIPLSTSSTAAYTVMTYCNVEHGVILDQFPDFITSSSSSTSPPVLELPD